VNILHLHQLLFANPVYLDSFMILLKLLLFVLNVKLHVQLVKTLLLNADHVMIKHII